MGLVLSSRNAVTALWHDITSLIQRDKTVRNVSILRILVLLLVVNSIKIPPNEVPVIHYPDLFVAGLATPFVILIKYDDDAIIEHEKCHIKQMNQYGSVWAFVVNFYYLQKYGYDNNPFEIEAYKCG